MGEASTGILCGFSIPCGLVSDVTVINVIICKPFVRIVTNPAQLCHETWLADFLFV